MTLPTPIRLWVLVAAGCFCLSAPAAPAPSLQSAGSVFQQGGSPDYIVSMEAENSSARVAAPDGHQWVLDTSYPGYSGAGTMRAMPDSGASNNTGYTTASPRLDFRVNFVATGTHRVYVRGYPPAGDFDDTVHVGLDGAAVSTADRIAWSTFGNYEWRNDTLDPQGATIDIPSTGIHTINVWMREDGFVFDKLVLTIDPPSAGPSGMGPAESTQVPDPMPSPGMLQFSAATYGAGEGAGTATVTVSRTGGISGSVSVNYATGGGSATAGSDYISASGTITFPNGDNTAKTFTVTLIDDALAESAETIDLALSAPSGGATLGGQSTAVMTLTDNDGGAPPPPVVPPAAGGGRDNDNGDNCLGSVGTHPGGLGLLLALLLLGMAWRR